MIYQVWPETEDRTIRCRRGTKTFREDTLDAHETSIDYTPLPDSVVELLDSDGENVVAVAGSQGRPDSKIVMTPVTDWQDVELCDCDEGDN